MNQKKFGGLLLAVCLGVASAQGQQKTERTKIIRDDSVSQTDTDLRWTHTSSDGKNEVSLTIKNAHFNDDYTDVESISPGGSFRISEEREGVVQRLEITREADGQLKRVYSLGGEARPYDAAARAWLAKLLSETVADSGYDAPARVRKVLAKRGVDGVLAEIPRLKSDYARRVYASALSEQGNLSGGQLAKLLSQTSSAIRSDYEKATLLIKILKNNLADAGARAAFFGMANTLGSDYERGRVLTVLLKRDDLSAGTLMLALKSVGGMSSDYEKANVLIRASNTGATDAPVRAAIIEAAHALGSDHERGRVLTAVTKKQL